jgi:hypothetical protein
MSPDNSNYFTPDSMWRNCDVQFRLVKFDTLDITDANCSNAGLPQGPGCADKLNMNSTDAVIEDVCGQFIELLEAKLGGPPTIPTVIVSFSLENTGGNGEGEVAVTPILGGKGPVTCIGRRAEGPQDHMALAHEVGHWDGQFDCGGDHDSGGQPNLATGCEMLAEFDTAAPPTNSECEEMHTWAVAEWANFWDRPCPPGGCHAP